MLWGAADTFGALGDDLLAEGGHDRGGEKAERYLIDGTLPGSDIGDVLGSGEVEDVVQELIIGLDPLRSDLEPQEFHGRYMSVQVFSSYYGI